MLLVFDDNYKLLCSNIVCGGISLIILYTGIIGFTANVVQFGMDQLHDSPGEDRTLFIHWYVWTYYGSKLVYRVPKFARQHKTPVNRIAFTYCEDEVPMGLDLEKEKYGRPFTTEQMEDVKAFSKCCSALEPCSS